MNDDREFTADPLDLPILSGRNPLAAQQPGRVRSTWKFPESASDPASSAAASVHAPRAWEPPLVSVSQLLEKHHQRTGVDWTQVARLLIDSGARLDVKDAAGKTPLDALAAKAGGRDTPSNEQMVKLIREQTARN